MMQVSFWHVKKSGYVKIVPPPPPAHIFMTMIGFKKVLAEQIQDLSCLLMVKAYGIRDFMLF